MPAVQAAGQADEYQLDRRRPSVFRREDLRVIGVELECVAVLLLLAQAENLLTVERVCVPPAHSLVARHWNFAASGACPAPRARPAVLPR